MEQHPIRRFIDQIFPGKEAENRAKWAQFFIDEKCDKPEQLMKMTETYWNAAAKTIPMPILNEIKENLSKRYGRLSPEVKKQISRFLTDGLSLVHILKNFGEKEDTPKGLAIIQEIKSLQKPPKPQPVGCKRVGVKLQQPTLPLYLYNGKRLQFAKYYTLLVVGETGSGKSTLLDAFVNKLTGIEFTDKWRWKLVDQDNIKDVPSGKSQTSEIKTYYVNDVNNRFNIRIIDTPGIGDTGGIKIDAEAVQKFESLLQNTPEIDYVLITFKSSEKGLRPGSQYVYNRVQQKFGGDAKDRFMLMCTFAESSTPLCIQTFQQQNLHFEKYFPFNNSAIYTPSGNSNIATAFFWKMGVDSIQNFEDYIIRADKSPLSLKHTKEVLKARRDLEDLIQFQQIAFACTLSELHVAGQDMKKWSQNKKYIEENGSYTKFETAIRYQYTDFGQDFQMCSICKVTCCQICKWPPNQKYSVCTYFNGEKGCPKCPGRCSRYAHVRTTDYIRKVVETKAVVIDCRQQALRKGFSLVQFYQDQLDRKFSNIKSISANLLLYSAQIKESLKKLQAFALQPKLWTDEDFYAEMIKYEEDKKEDRWTERVQYLRRDVLARLKTLEKIEKIVPIESLFPELNTLKEEYQKSDPSIKKV